MKDKRVLITGAYGFLGSHFVEVLKDSGYKKLLLPKRSELDLMKQGDVECYLRAQKPEVVVHIAADIGGIGYSKTHPGSQLYNNTIMNMQLQHYCYLNGVEKFVGIGTVCSYPKHTEVPFNIRSLWDGYPEETNAAYGISKKIMMEQSKAYRQQYGFNAIHLLMINLYGPRDDFDLETSHVIPAMLQKMHNAKLQGEHEVVLWGDGSPSREFLYVDDAARAIKLCMETYDGIDPINIGVGKEITIRQLVSCVKDIVGYDGEVIWDTDKPNGQPRRCLDVSDLHNLGFEASTSFVDGLEKTYEYYKTVILAGK